ncbi:MAG: LysR substrate-binding domain-containing protein [Saprospiraceae bacterium]|nr:LysR substrate-binding domain-containing protein [Saprospiraceae bacterium]
MTLQQLEYIIAVDNHRHFAKAAQACFVTQPTLSMMLQKLEEELGILIFDRSKQPVVPTEIGRIVIEQARKVLQETAELREIVENQREILRGELRLGIIPTLAPYLLPLFLKGFSEKYPDIRLIISELMTHDITQKLKKDQLDIGIMATPTDDGELFETFLFKEQFVVYAAENEAILNKRFLLAQDIDVNRLVLLEEGHCMRTQIINLCELRQTTNQLPNIFYESGSIETLKNLIDIHSGITILPELALQNLSKAQFKNVRFFQNPAPVREISIVTYRAFVKKRLVEVLKKEILAQLPLALEKINRFYL